ncbi:probable NAD(P)H dehydrogenase subunit CRR3, chloroplastic [Alnus glutinosa]|uniref:probable NAD(P)H dehydrogenase subunit CRR3, chloroplastic n=1 Tax=Alnus glutinosa TaxID=3517 RepID=UPI002D776C77|nr:probable NAD(P)H dehydrogenase subunit CRR3, chloroplastic [Alnus glutinosa]
MYCLSCLSITKPLVLASLPTNGSPPPPLPPIQTNPTKPPMHTTKPTTSLPKKKQQQQQNKRQRPSIAEIERAIGAGRYRDIDASELKEEEVANFDFISMSFTGMFEGPVEKKLRETGEWLTTSTESRFRASGKKILMFIFQWMLPIWTLSLLMTSGVIKLPFSTPFLDDLVM